MTDYLPRWDEVAPFATEIALIVSILAVLVTPMFSIRRKILNVAIAAATGLGIALAAAVLTRGIAVDSPSVYFGGLLMHDPFAWVAKLLLVLANCIVMALWYADSHDKFIARGQTQDASEFFALLFASTLGLCLMTATSHLVVMLIAIELATMPAYVLVGFRKHLRPSAAASTRSILVGMGATAVTLYGMSLLYGLFGTLDLQQFGAYLRGRHPGVDVQGVDAVLLIVALAATLVGPVFKIILAPLNPWCSDVCGGGTIDVATFVALSFPVAGFAMLSRILVAIVGPGHAGLTGHGSLVVSLAWILLVTGGAATICGSLAALRQNNIKRLLACSTLTHAGFVLLAAIAILSPGESLRLLAPFGWSLVNAPAAEAAMCYVMFLLFMNGGAFIAAAAIAQRLTGPAEAGMSLGVERFTPSGPLKSSVVPAATGEQLSDYLGLSRRTPILAATMLFFLLASAGLPLTVGFSGRLKIITTLVDTANPLAWIAIALIALGTILCACAYLRVVRQMYLVETDTPRLIEIAPVTIVALVLIIPTFVLFLAYGWVDRQAQRHTQLLTPPPIVNTTR